MLRGLMEGSDMIEIRSRRAEVTVGVTGRIMPVYWSKTPTVAAMIDVERCLVELIQANRPQKCVVILETGPEAHAPPPEVRMANEEILKRYGPSLEACGVLISTNTKFRGLLVSAFGFFAARAHGGGIPMCVNSSREHLLNWMIGHVRGVSYSHLDTVMRDVKAAHGT
jgi:hypothetical protein